LYIIYVREKIIRIGSVNYETITSFFVLDIIDCDNDPPCHVNATCNDIPGSYECNCSEGLTGNGTYCEGIDIFYKYNFFKSHLKGCEVFYPSIHHHVCNIIKHLIILILFKNYWYATINMIPCDSPLRFVWEFCVKFCEKRRLRAVPPFRGFRFPGKRKERRDCRQHIKKWNTRCPHNAKFPLVEIDTPVNQIWYVVIML
jgi:hypothetical protein